MDPNEASNLADGEGNFADFDKKRKFFSWRAKPKTTADEHRQRIADALERCLPEMDYICHIDYKVKLIHEETESIQGLTYRRGTIIGLSSSDGMVRVEVPVIEAINLEQILFSYSLVFRDVESLTLRDGQFGGNFPRDILRIMPKLKHLDLRGSVFEGGVPDSVRNNPQFDVLRVDCNDDVRSVRLERNPDIHSLSTFLKHTRASVIENETVEIRGAGKTRGSIQFEGQIAVDVVLEHGTRQETLDEVLGDDECTDVLMNVRRLEVRNSKMCGRLPPELITAMPQATHLVLSNCGLDGQLPEELFTRGRHLQEVDLSVNDLESGEELSVARVSSMEWRAFNVAGNKRVKTLPRLHNLRLLEVLVVIGTQILDVVPNIITGDMRPSIVVIDSETVEATTETAITNAIVHSMYLNLRDKRISNTRDLWAMRFGVWYFYAELIIWKLGNIVAFICIGNYRRAVLIFGLTWAPHVLLSLWPLFFRSDADKLDPHARATVVSILKPRKKKFKDFWIALFFARPWVDYVGKFGRYTTRWQAEQLLDVYADNIPWLVLSTLKYMTSDSSTGGWSMSFLIISMVLTPVTAACKLETLLPNDYTKLPWLGICFGIVELGLRVLTFVAYQLMIGLYEDAWVVALLVFLVVSGLRTLVYEMVMGTLQCCRHCSCCGNRNQQGCNEVRIIFHWFFAIFSSHFLNKYNDPMNPSDETVKQKRILAKQILVLSYTLEGAVLLGCLNPYYHVFTLPYRANVTQSLFYVLLAVVVMHFIMQVLLLYGCCSGFCCDSMPSAATTTTTTIAAGQQQRNGENLSVYVDEGAEYHLLGNGDEETQTHGNTTTTTTTNTAALVPQDSSGHLV